MRTNDPDIEEVINEANKLGLIGDVRNAWIIDALASRWSMFHDEVAKVSAVVSALIQPVKIFVFGHVDVHTASIEMGSLATEEDISIVLSVVKNRYPVSLAGLPNGFVPCYNTLADISDLEFRGFEFEVIEMENESHDPSFMLPDNEAVTYYKQVWHFGII